MTFRQACRVPTAMPVTIRTASSMVNPVAIADNPMPSATISAATTIVRRRPTMSATWATTIDPAAMPNNAELSRMPSCDPLSDHSSEICEALNASASTSNPSSMFNSTQIVTTAYCSGCMGADSMRALML